MDCGLYVARVCKSCVSVLLKYVASDSRCVLLTDSFWCFLLLYDPWSPYSMFALTTLIWMVHVLDKYQNP